jgi:maleate isomerase
MQRLGVILPSSNTTVETEFSSTLHGSEISLHVTRIPLKDVTVEGLFVMEKKTQAAARLLKDANVDAVVFACTSGSLAKGIGQDQAIAQKINDVTHSPVVVTSTAVVDALKALSAQDLSVVTPYVEEVNQKEVAFLEGSGFRVTTLRSFNLKSNLEIGNLTPQDTATLALNTGPDSTQAVFISCTNLRAFEKLPFLEQSLQKPVVSSNSATLWAALKVLGSKFQPPLGKLFGLSG